MKTRFLNLIGLSMVFGFLCGCNHHDSSSTNITPIDKDSETPLRLFYDEEAPRINEGSPKATMAGGGDIGWERWSLPLGNGYFGANVFGRTESERIQITEKTLSNPWRIYDKSGREVEIGGLNSFSETYIDFNHNNSQVEDYCRYLDVRTAISGVRYTYKGVRYNREYFTSYPDKALVIYLESDGGNQIDFTLRPTIPYKQSYSVFKGDGVTKEGNVTSKINDGVGIVELEGKLGYYDVDFYGQYRVYTSGGSMNASLAYNNYRDTDGVEHKDLNGTIEVAGANKAFIVVTLGTDYELSSDVFTSKDRFKPTAFKTIEEAKRKVNGYMDDIVNQIKDRTFDDSYSYLKNRHLQDYKELYERSSFNLDFDKDDLTLPTDSLLRKYQVGYKSNYLEMLLFHYSRYLLIASSRPGALPANLQGAWNMYNVPPWSSGYWHNINVQMNYWPAFSTDLSETFVPYVDFNKAYMKQAENNADNLVFTNNRSVYKNDGGNGWTIGVANNPYFINGDRSSGNMGFTTQLYWDYYQFTKDEKVLKLAFDVLSNAARYVTKCVKKNKEGKYLVEFTDSPEQYVDGKWYYTSGTTYAQTFSYLNNYYTLLAAKELGVDLTDKSILSQNEYAVLKTILEQIDKYDPINIGLSGQIKEFREEGFYGSIGDPGHRHISQLVGLCPGNIITSSTPAWIDAAKKTLEGRDGQNNAGPILEQVGWSFVHRMGMYARTKDNEHAHKMLSELINKQMTTNLLTMCGNVFQIEAILGTSATIGETVMQSHEGYIDLLPALPNSWNKGSFDGLVARGNFKVSANWDNHQLKRATITSNKGGKVRLSYPFINSVAVMSNDGAPIHYEYEGDNIISFETETGQTYSLTNFANKKKVEKVNHFKFERKNLEAFEFSWEKVNKASGYRLYKAIENESDYTYIGSTLNNTYSYVPEKSERNKRTTFAIVAVDPTGNISDRANCFYNPIDADAYIANASYTILADGKLQVSVEANERAFKYRLYERKTGHLNFDIIDESNYPLLYASSYDSRSEYAVSALSYFTKEETPLKVINRNVKQNIALGKRFVPTPEAAASEYSDNYKYDCLTDGIFEENRGRFSSKINGMMDATIDLNGNFGLSELRLYVYNNDINFSGKSLVIEAFINNKWSNIYTINSTNELSRYLTANYLSFDLSNVVATKVRIASIGSVSGYSISFYEAELYGFSAQGVSLENGDNVIKGTAIATDGGCSSLNNVNDGDLFTSALISSSNGKCYIDISLPKLQELWELDIYEKLTEGITASDNTKVEVLFNGEWVTVAQGLTLDTISGKTSINLHGLMSNRIRITFENTLFETNGKALELYEITCTNGNVSDLSSIRAALDLLKDEMDIYDANYIEFCQYARNIYASDEDISKYLSKINEFIDN